MKKLFRNITGDQQLWAYTVLLMLFSFLAVYSASSNLVNVYGKITPWQFAFKHLIHVALGVLIIFVVHKFNAKYFSHLSKIMLPVVIGLLIYTLTKGITIGGANASRWIMIPMLGSFQPSTVAFVFLMMFTARFLGKNELNQIGFSEALKNFWVWVFIIVGLIFPANLSTAVLIFSMVIMLTIVAGYPFRHLIKVFGIGLLGVVMMILVFKAFPNSFSNRLDTWQSRIEHFISSDDTDESTDMMSKSYQSTQAKIAIAKGGLIGFNPGKSVQKNFLPQSVSDFIYAIIIEEYSLSGGLILLFVYLLVGLRIFIIIKKVPGKYYKLLALGVGFPLIFQALTNMAVAVGLFPVTGQPLPLVSSGGTAIWMSCVAIGVILSVSREIEKEELKAEELI